MRWSTVYHRDDFDRRLVGQLIEKFLDRDINLSPSPVGELPALEYVQGRNNIFWGLGFLTPQEGMGGHKG